MLILEKGMKVTIKDFKYTNLGILNDPNDFLFKEFIIKEVKDFSDNNNILIQENNSKKTLWVSSKDLILYNEIEYTVLKKEIKELMKKNPEKYPEKKINVDRIIQKILWEIDHNYRKEDDLLNYIKSKFDISDELIFKIYRLFR